MPKRAVVIARTKAEGRAWESPNTEVVAVITPRSEYAARGVTADFIIVDPAMQNHRWIGDYMDEAEPSVAPSRVTQ